LTADSVGRRCGPGKMQKQLNGHKYVKKNVTLTNINEYEYVLEFNYFNTKQN